MLVFILIVGQGGGFYDIITSAYGQERRGKISQGGYEML